MKPFGEELRAMLNGYSKENESNTPDLVLAKYIERCLDAFDEATRARDSWYGVNLRPGHGYREPSSELATRVFKQKLQEATCPVCGYFCRGSGGVGCIDKSWALK